MPRTRSLKPSFFTDAELTLFPPLHRIAFEGLWVYADKRGVLEDKPRELKVQILPFDDVDFDAILTDLCRPKSDGSLGFIRRYQVGGKRYIHIRKFLAHQKPHIKETKFELVPDPPPEETPAEPGPNPGKVSTSPGQSGAQPGPTPGQSAGSLVLGSWSGSLVLGAGSPEPRPAPPPSDGMDWFAWAQDERSVRRPGLIPEYPNDGFDAFFRAAMEHLRGDVDRLRDAWRCWLEDPWAATRKPPYAMRPFQDHECWVKHVPELHVATLPRGPDKASKLNRPVVPTPGLEEIPF